MPRPIPAAVESEFAPAFAAVRAQASALRELDAQVSKSEERAVAAEKQAVASRRIAGQWIAARENGRLELGLALLRARVAWPERGPKAKGWGEFLKREGIAESTARHYMDLAKGEARETPAEDFAKDGRLSEIPHPADLPEGTAAAAPSERKALGLLADMQLLVGRWEDVLSTDEIGEVDTLITDAPYSARTHAGGREGERGDGYSDDGLAPEYTHWDAEIITAFVEAWSPRVRGWMVALCDHHLIDAWSLAYERMGRYVFAPVPCVINGMTVRLAGDGPSSWSVYAMVSRPMSLSKWGTLPGAYTGGREPGAKGGRGKPRWLMDALVRDYSREGDLVCDPLAGYGVTLMSALLQRRRAIGAEVEAAAVDEAFKRANALNEEPITEASAA
jgi:hypothetical protein